MFFVRVAEAELPSPSLQIHMGQRHLGLIGCPTQGMQT